MQRLRTPRSTQGSRRGETSRRGYRSSWLVLLGLVLSVAALPSAAFGQAVVKAVKPGTMGPGNVSTCFWGQPVLECRTDQ